MSEQTTEYPLEILCRICSFISDQKTFDCLSELGKKSPAVAEATKECFKRAASIAVDIYPDKCSIKVDNENAGKFQTPTEMLDWFRMVIKKPKNLQQVSLSFDHINTSDRIIPDFIFALTPQQSVFHFKIKLGPTHDLTHSSRLLTHALSLYPNLEVLCVDGIDGNSMDPYLESNPEIYDYDVDAAKQDLLEAISNLDRLRLLTTTETWSSGTFSVDWMKRKVVLSSYTTIEANPVVCSRNDFHELKKNDLDSAVFNFEELCTPVYRYDIDLKTLIHYPRIEKVELTLFNSDHDPLDFPFLVSVTEDIFETFRRSSQKKQIKLVFIAARETPCREVVPWELWSWEKVHLAIGRYNARINHPLYDSSMMRPHPIHMPLNNEQCIDNIWIVTKGSVTISVDLSFQI